MITWNYTISDQVYIYNQLTLVSQLMKIQEISKNYWNNAAISTF